MSSSELLQSEFNLQKILRTIDTDLIIPGNPNILCTPLPNHWRSNKALSDTFKVFCVTPIANGTRVSLSAGNTEDLSTEMRGFQAEMRNQVAVFQDLRFLGKSGRGKKFNITITVESRPPQISLYTNAIKITVDGPREPRKYKSSATSNVIKAAGVPRKEYSPIFPSCSPKIITKKLIQEAVDKTRFIRQFNLKRIYCFSSDEECDQFTKKIAKSANPIETALSSCPIKLTSISNYEDTLSNQNTQNSIKSMKICHDNHDNQSFPFSNTIQIIAINDDTLSKFIGQIKMSSTNTNPSTSHHPTNHNPTTQTTSSLIVHNYIPTLDTTPNQSETLTNQNS